MTNLLVMYKTFYRGSAARRVPCQLAGIVRGSSQAERGSESSKRSAAGKDHCAAMQPDKKFTQFIEALVLSCCCLLLATTKMAQAIIIGRGVPRKFSTGFSITIPLKKYPFFPQSKGLLYRTIQNYSSESIGCSQGAV